jgi:ABC-type transporter Mla subunit MlaD
VRPGTLLRLALAAVVALVAAIVLTGGEDPYVIDVRMANANGLKDGSPVTIGGVKIGKVEMEVDPRRDDVIAHLRIDRDKGPVGRDVKAVIAAQNLLGQKQIELQAGDRSNPAPDGYVITERRVTQATDLDRVLSVLDGNTRARLAIFVNELGAAMTGRKADFHRILDELRPAIARGTNLVAELADDNAELGRLLDSSDRFVAEATDRRADITRAIDRFGQAATAGAERRVALRGTLASAPTSLATLQRFLGELERTTEPLRGAAQQVRRSAQPLRGVLAQLEPFRRSAAPALATATDVAPDLTKVARRSTPVLGEARTTAQLLERTSSQDLPVVSEIGDRAIDNALAVVGNWAGAIQYRDRLSHIFRGEASVGLDTVVSLLERVERGAGSSPAEARASARRVAKALTERRAVAPDAARQAAGAAASGGSTATATPAAAANPVADGVRQTVDGVQGFVDGVVGQLSGGRDRPAPSRSPNALLDLLLGP